MALLAIAGTIASAVGQVQAGQAAAAEGKTQQQMSEYNAKLQEREAATDEQRTTLESKRQAQDADRRRSSMLAELGSSGVVTTSGSPLLILGEQAEQNEIDNMMIGYDGRQRQQAMRSGASLSRMEGSYARARGKNAKTAGYVGAGASLLHGFGATYTASGSKDEYLKRKYGV